MDTESLKTGYVGLIGRPNVGKSTLMNKIIGQKIAITSNKPQTTRNKILSVYTEDRGQIVFLDSPGIHQAKNKLGEYMMKASASVIADCDVIMWLVEPATFIGGGEKHIIELLKQAAKPVILVINKSDTVKKDELLPVIAKYSKEYDFDEIVPVSALNGQNTEELVTCLFKHLPYGPLYYDEETVTDQSMRTIAAEIIREKSLKCLSDEIPHGIAVYVDKMHTRKSGDITDIEATIVCERESHKGIIIGKGGAMLKKIGSAARYEIEEMIEGQANLKLFVKVRKEWRDDDSQLKNFGYSDK